MTVTLRAIPLPLLVTVSVYPTWSPAETDALSAVFTIAICAASTVTEAEAESVPSLLVVTDAVLSTGELNAVSFVVGELTCTV